MIVIRKKDIYKYASEMGLTLETHSPGDGYTRYCFTINGSERRLLGAREAWIWLLGYETGKNSDRP